jgi:hypothetical protein
MLNKIKEKYPKVGKCCLCGGYYYHYGNNPAPLNKGKGRCCDDCNTNVILARMMVIKK